MAPKKKNKPNAVYFFAKEYQVKNNLRESVYETISRTYTIWQELPEAEKEKYKKMASDQRSQQQKQEPIDPIKEEKLETEVILNKIDQYISSISNEPIEDQSFYMIKFLSLCRTHEVQEEYNSSFAHYFVLAEVGLIEYQLRTGIVNEYHAFIETTKIPLGYYAECKDNSERFRIPFGKDSNLPTKKHSLVYEDICHFIKKKGPIFCMPSDIEETQFALDYLRKSLQYVASEEEQLPDGPFNDDIYGLDVLSVRLAQDKYRMSLKEALSMLNKYTYDHSSDTKCTHHDEVDTLWCALGLIKRKAYLISDYICPMYGIEISADTRHLPVERDVGVVVRDELEELKQSSKRLRYADDSEGFRSSKQRRNNNESDEEWKDVPRPSFSSRPKTEPRDRDYDFPRNSQSSNRGSFSHYESQRGSIGRGKRYYQN